MHKAPLWVLSPYNMDQCRSSDPEFWKFISFTKWKEIIWLLWEICECSFFSFFFFFFCLQWFMNLLICNRCVQPHTGKLWLVKSISILIILMLHIFAYRVWPLWKVANIFLLNEFFWMELSPPQPVMHFGRIQEQQRNYRIWWKKNWYKTKNSICRGDLSEATNITLFSAPSCQLSALLTQLWCSPFDIYQMVAKLAKYLEDFQDIFRRSSLI